MIWAKHLGVPGAESAMPPLNYSRQAADISPKSRSQFVINTSGSSFSPTTTSSAHIYNGHLHEGIKATGLRRSDFDHVSAFKPVGLGGGGGHRPGSPDPPVLRTYSPVQS